MNGLRAAALRVTRRGRPRALRACHQVGLDARVDGTPTVGNRGRIVIGARFCLVSRPVASHLVADEGAVLEIGDDVAIAHGAAISAYERIVIGDKTIVGPFVAIMDSDFHVAGNVGPSHQTVPVVIGRGVTIGSHVTILRGATIGDGAWIDSGSVVTGEIAAGTRVAGVPARAIATPLVAGRASGTGEEPTLPRIVMHALGMDRQPGPDEGAETITQWDSLGTLRIVLAIEEQLGLSLEARDLLRARSISDLDKLVLGARNGAARLDVQGKRHTRFYSPAVRSTEPIWHPDPVDIAGSQMTAFERLVETNREVLPPSDVPDALALQAFSVANFRAFWQLFLDWSGLDVEGEREPVCDGDDIETAVFFPNARLNFARSLLRSVAPDDAPAITACNERGAVVRMKRGELRRRVLSTARELSALGVRAGDRVVAIAANDAEAVVACLATAAIGATWSSVSPDLGVDSIVARFGQLEPRLLFARIHHLDNGKVIDISARVAAVLQALPSVAVAVALGDGEIAVPTGRDVTRTSLCALWAGEGGSLDELELFPFNHPLFILFSSGTTGRPKCIVHGAGGTLLEHHKEHRLHCDLRLGDKLYFHTTTAWMMWNWLVSALSVGAEIVVYEGSVSYPEPDSLWKLVGREGVTHFGTSPAFVQFAATAGIVPRECADLSSLRAILSTGAVLPDTAFEWICENAKHVAVQSISGGTDIIGCFLLGHPNLPVFAGELQSKSLGLDVRAFGATRDQPVGELVCANPFPSRPIGLYGDATGERFHATYFAQNQGLWTHGDRFEWTERNTGRIHGRSDGIMNIRGIRIGPAELYAALADVEAIADCMAVEQRAEDEPGGSRLLLLVVLAALEAPLDDALVARVRDLIGTRCSRAHIPAAIVAVPDLPVTHNGKRAERAARDAANGDPVANLEALRNPGCVESIRAALGARPSAR